MRPKRELSHIFLPPTHTTNLLLLLPSYRDKDFWMRNYENGGSEEAKEYTKMQMDDVEKKYPGWSNRLVYPNKFR